MERQVVQYCTAHEHVCWNPSYEREDIKYCSFEAVRLGDLVSYVRRRTMENMAAQIHKMAIRDMQRNRPKTKL